MGTLADDCWVAAGILDVFISDAVCLEVEVVSVVLVHAAFVLLLTEAFMIFPCRDFGRVVSSSFMGVGGLFGILFRGDVLGLVEFRRVSETFVPGIDVAVDAAVLEVVEAASELVNLTCEVLSQLFKALGHHGNEVHIGVRDRWGGDGDGRICRWGQGVLVDCHVFGGEGLAQCVELRQGLILEWWCWGLGPRGRAG